MRIPRSRARIGRHLVSDLRERKKSAAFFHMTFVNLDLPAREQLTRQQKKQVEALIGKSFDLWWTTWVDPLIDEVEDRIVKPNRKKST